MPHRRMGADFVIGFHRLSIAALLLGVACAVVVLVDVVRRPQHMKVMNVVGPVTALFGIVFIVWGYFRYAHAAHDVSQPMPVVVGKGTLHCGAGCMIGDLVAEWLAFWVPAVALGFGWQSIVDDKMFAVWGLDFVFAFVLGIAFQYFAIVPMRKLSPRQGIVAALKADALSLASWQIGMYGFMALVQLVLYPHVFGRRAEVDTPEFWFAMQLAMIAGFFTAYPVNWWLIRSGIKEKM